MVAKIKRWVWISTPRFTVRADLDDFGYVKYTAPISKWMRGIHIDDLKTRLQKRWDNQLQFKLFEEKMIDVEEKLTSEQYRTKLFNAYGEMSKTILKFREIIQNEMMYSIEQKDKWVKMVTSAGQDMKQLNSKTLHYIEDNIK